MKKEYLSEERREQRRLIRERNQKLAYTVVAGLVLGIIALMVLMFFVGRKDDNAGAGQGQNANGAEDVFSSEAELTPPPATTAEPVPTMSPEALIEQEIGQPHLTAGPDNKLGVGSACGVQIF